MRAAAWHAQPDIGAVEAKRGMAVRSQITGNLMPSTGFTWRGPLKARPTISVLLGVTAAGTLLVASRQWAHSTVTCPTALSTPLAVATRCVAQVPLTGTVRWIALGFAALGIGSLAYWKARNRPSAVVCAVIFMLGGSGWLLGAGWAVGSQPVCLNTSHSSATYTPCISP